MSNERRCSRVFMWDVSVEVGCMRLLKQVRGDRGGGRGKCEGWCPGCHLS